MTKDQLIRASELIHTRDEIKEFLTARDPKSDFVQGYAKSQYDFQKQQAKQIPVSRVVEITLMNADRCDLMKDQEPDNLVYWYIARDVVENALRAYLPKIETEIKILGITE